MSSNKARKARRSAGHAAVQHSEVAVPPEPGTAPAITVTPFAALTAAILVSDDVDGKLRTAGDSPEVVVELSSRIPDLLTLAGDISQKVLTQFIPGSTDSSDAEPLPPGHELSNYFIFQRYIHMCVGIITTLSRTSRLPQPHVLHQMGAPTVAEQHVGWMEDLAERILQYSQQPASRRRASRPPAAPAAAAGDPSAQMWDNMMPTWKDMGSYLLGLWSYAQQLHVQCMIAMAETAAAASAAAAAAAAGAPATSSVPDASSSGGSHDQDTGASSSSSSSIQAASSSTAAPADGTPWEWKTVVDPSQEDLVLAFTLQSQSSWLRPNLVRLAHTWLRHIKYGEPNRLTQLGDAALTWVAVQLAPVTHPRIVALGMGGPAVAAAVGKLGKRPPPGLRDMGWGCLATGSQVLREHQVRLLGTPSVAPAMHPALGRCPAYHLGRSYSGAFEQPLSSNQHLMQYTGDAELAMVVSEVWDLWPWQLQLIKDQLQLPEQQKRYQRACKEVVPDEQKVRAGQGPIILTKWPQWGLQEQPLQVSSSSSSSSSGGGNGGSSSGGSSNTPPEASSSVSQQPTETATPAAPASSNSSGNCMGDSSSSSSSSGGSSCPSPRLIPWPLLPSAVPLLRRLGTSSSAAAPPECQLPPVVLRQLCLVLERVCLTVDLAPQYARNSLMLMVLLLLRADLALRLQFLHSPQGGLLMAALQLYGCGKTPVYDAMGAEKFGMNITNMFGLFLSSLPGEEGVAQAVSTRLATSLLCEAASTGVILNWLLLQPKDVGKEVSCSSSAQGMDGPSSSRDSSCPGDGDAGDSSSSSTPAANSSSSSISGGSDAQGMTWFPAPIVYFGTPLDRSAGLPCMEVPAAALELLPGYVPDVQLFATLETLLVQGIYISVLLEAIAASYQQDPSRAPPPASPMWLTLASMAAAVRKQAALVVAFSVDDGKQRQDSTERLLNTLLPLLRLAAVAQQQPGAGWGALVLGSAVQGAALVLCALAMSLADHHMRGVAGAMLLHNTQTQQQQPQEQQQQALQLQALAQSQLPLLDVTRQGVVCRSTMMYNASMRLCMVLNRLGHRAARVPWLTPAQAQGDVVMGPGQSGTAAAAEAGAAGAAADAAAEAAVGPSAAAAEAAPPPAVAAAAPPPLPPLAGFGEGPEGPHILRVDLALQQAAAGIRYKLLEVRNLLAGLRSGWPTLQAAQSCGKEAASSDATTSQSAAAAPAAAAAATMAAGAPAHAARAARAMVARIDGNSSNPVVCWVHGMLHLEAGLMDMCEAAAACAQVCGSRLQLLGCAHLGCTTPPAAGLGGCEASLVVNCRGSVCGGCGVVRYCSAACAQQDWAGHRRVCRRLAAAAAGP